MDNASTACAGIYRINLVEDVIYSQLFNYLVYKSLKIIFWMTHRAWGFKYADYAGLIIGIYNFAVNFSVVSKTLT